MHEKIEKNISERGWHVFIIAQDDEGPAFAYTVGLFESFDHPELLIIGLDVGEVGGRMHQTINLVGDMIKDGQSFAANSESTEIVEGYSVAFRSIDKSHYPKFLGAGVDYRDHENFPCHQIVWPDKTGKFPWDTKFAEELVWFQPLLFSVE